jgi:DNA-binding PadR family transcriptional regulator
VSSIRLYILGSLAERGPMHGHALVALAEEEHVNEWTDISVGGLYGAAKRLATDGLIEVDRVERHGNYPERQVFAITDTGRATLRDMQRQALTELSWRHDPVDLGVSRLDPAALDELEDVVRERRDRIAATLDEARIHRERIRQYLNVAEWIATKHGLYRLEAELAWHEEFLAAVPDIIRDERDRTSKNKEDR